MYSLKCFLSLRERDKPLLISLKLSAALKGKELIKGHPICAVQTFSDTNKKPHSAAQYLQRPVLAWSSQD